MKGCNKERRKQDTVCKNYMNCQRLCWLHIPNTFTLREGERNLERKQENGLSKKVSVTALQEVVILLDRMNDGPKANEA